MFRNYFKIAWRNLLKDRQFTFLNLVGLSTGLACTFLIYLWVHDELQVDKYNDKDAQLYQVMVNEHQEDGIRTAAYTPGLLADALKKEIPEVEYAVTVLPASWFQNKGIISYDDAHFKAESQFVGKDYFDVFTSKFIDGDKERLLADKYTVAISEDLAMKLFHTTKNIIGKTIHWDHQQFTGTYAVSGIFEKNPSNATNQFDILLNFELFKERRPGMEIWSNMDPHTYVILKKGAKLDLVNNKVQHFLETKDKNIKTELFLFKYSDKYLYGQFENGKQAGGRISYVRLFSIIAIFILIIACINFMNLSTARASRRIKEVGIKKVVGARRITLVLQYLGESMLLTLLSLALAIVLIVLLLPEFNNITGKHIRLSFDAGLISSIAAITLITGLIAGSYPALYLSGFKPAAVLKGKLKTSIGELWIRKGLVVFQFILSVVFIVSVLVVYRQVSYIQSTNLGYSRSNIVHFEIPFEVDSAKLKRAANFLEELKTIPGVMNVSSYYHNLTGDHGSIGGFEWPGKNPNMKVVDFANLEVGYNFIETLGMQMKEGAGFSKNDNAQHEIVFNEAAIQAMGLKDPIGKTVKFWDQQRKIVGVVKNFNFESLYSSVKPCFFQVYPVMPNVMVKIKGGTERQSIAQIEKIFREFNKGYPFDYQFLDENYNALYESERRVGVLSRYFAGLAIIISCLGLFGLAAFTAQRRQKEIGIRKVVGASVTNVVLMLSKDFLRLVLIAVFVAFPIAWWMTSQWLNSFAYRIHIGSDIFLLSGIATILITLVTISYQAIKAAVANPVRSLRAE
ncbi:MAG: ABC transporter permease [Bacteroidetes bacterium]|nr:ABC transporter permease [Bacteroidota bacterium]